MDVCSDGQPGDSSALPKVNQTDNDREAPAVGNPFEFLGTEEDLIQLLGTKIWFRD